VKLFFFYFRSGSGGLAFLCEEELYPSGLAAASSVQNNSVTFSGAHDIEVTSPTVRDQKCEDE
jgi:hypothetical protein